MSEDELSHMADGLQYLIVPEMTVAAEIDGQVVGAAFGLPDYNPRIKEIDGRLLPFGFVRLLRNKKAIKKIRLISTNVIPEFQRYGIGLVLMQGLGAKGHGMGIAGSGIFLGTGIELAFLRQSEKRRSEDHQDISPVRLGGHCGR